MPMRKKTQTATPTVSAAPRKRRALPLVQMFEIRYWPSPLAYSKPFSNRLVTKEKGEKAVTRLVARGIEAFLNPLNVHLSAQKAATK